MENQVVYLDMFAIPKKSDSRSNHGVSPRRKMYKDIMTNCPIGKAFILPDSERPRIRGNVSRVANTVMKDLIKQGSHMRFTSYVSEKGVVIIRTA